LKPEACGDHKSPVHSAKLLQLPITQKFR